MCTLLKIAIDKTFEGLIKVEKGKRSYRQRETDKRHKTGMEISSQDVSFVADNPWCVHLQEDKKPFYDVQDMRKECSCQVRCAFCYVCIHLYTCKCRDFGIRSLACKHIHAVHVAIQSEKVEKYEN